MNVAADDVPLMLQYARWYRLNTVDYLENLPACQCAKLKADDERYGPCGRCHTALQLSRVERFLQVYG